MSTEVGKHRHSLYLTLNEWYARKWKQLRPKVLKMIPYIKVTIRILVMLVFARLCFILLKKSILKYFGVELWEMISMWTQSANILNKLHAYVDWISKLNSIDVYSL